MEFEFREKQFHHLDLNDNLNRKIVYYALKNFQTNIENYKKANPLDIKTKDDLEYIKKFIIEVNKKIPQTLDPEKIYILYNALTELKYKIIYEPNYVAKLKQLGIKNIKSFKIKLNEIIGTIEICM